MWQLGTPPLELVARTALVYLMFLFALRIFGKREVGQFTIFDVALILLAANALQPAMTGSDASIPGAAIIIATIFGLNAFVAQLRDRVPMIARLFASGVTTLGSDGRWDFVAMRREGLDVEDLEAALREHGLETVDQMKLATLEEDGSISIVPTDAGTEAGARARRRRRYKRR